ncbi:hypothetical protein ACJIZ3_017847 [Penstemon smallii]|uniref:Uncharacterized protein n=1 Tax=Penstemon smallii TaxID=265156 RepID=A0ABD3SXH3_9LAMI
MIKVESNNRYLFRPFGFIGCIIKRQEEESDIYNNRINFFSKFISSMSLLRKKVLKDESD